MVITGVSWLSSWQAELPKWRGDCLTAEEEAGVQTERLPKTVLKMMTEVDGVESWD